MFEDDDIRRYEIDLDRLKKDSNISINTSKGRIKFVLLYNEAPNTVANFLKLVENKFYNGLKFHRVIDGFMAQAGCPYGNGMGGPGWRIECECQNNTTKHKKGALSMAHAGKDTGGSQFFICFDKQPHLDGEHTVFGYIKDDDKDSFLVLDSIEQDDIIESIKIENFDD